LTTKEFHLLKLRVYDGDNVIYEGMSEDVPEDISNKQIVVDQIVDKVLVVKISK
jgi:hypothetical protein